MQIAASTANNPQKHERNAHRWYLTMSSSARMTRIICFVHLLYVLYMRWIYACEKFIHTKQTKLYSMERGCCCYRHDCNRVGVESSESTKTIETRWTKYTNFECSFLRRVWFGESIEENNIKNITVVEIVEKSLKPNRAEAKNTKIKANRARPTHTLSILFLLHLTVFVLGLWLTCIDGIIKIINLTIFRWTFACVANWNGSGFFCHHHVLAF